MSLRIPNPDRPTDKQIEFIKQLAMDCTTPFPNFKTLTYSAASELINELIEVKKELMKEVEGEPEWD